MKFSLHRSRFGEVIVVLLFAAMLSHVIGLLAGYGGAPVNPFDIATPLFHICFISICLVSVTFGPDERATILRTSTDLSHSVSAILLGLILYVLAIGLTGVEAYLRALASGEIVFKSVSAVGEPSMGSRGILSYFLLTVLCAPYVEEVIYRGVLLTPYVNKSSFAVQALCASLLFGVVHGVDQFVAASIFGLAMAYQYRLFKSLWPCILSHATSNFLTITEQMYPSRWRNCENCAFSDIHSWHTEIILLATGLLGVALYFAHFKRLTNRIGIHANVTE